MFENKAEQLERELYDIIDVDTVIVQCNKPADDAVREIAGLSAMVGLIDQLIGEGHTEYPTVECLQQLTALCKKHCFGLSTDDDMPLADLRRHVITEIDWEQHKLDKALADLRKRLQIEPKYYSEDDKEIARKCRENLYQRKG